MRNSVFFALFPLLLAHAIPVFAQPEAGVFQEQKEAPCLVADGYQTVKFDDSTSYSGYFLNCHPQAGKAVAITNGRRIVGRAKPIGDDQVVLSFRGGSVTIKVVTRQY